MYKKTKLSLDGVVRHNTLRILFLLFSFFTMHFSLQAKEALPVLVEAGEPFENRNDYYIPHQSSVHAVALSKDGKTIISGSSDDSIKIWNRATGKLEKTLEGHTGSVTYVALSQDGKTIISGSDDNSIKIWNRATGKLEKTLEGHTNSVSSVALSSDGKSIISGSDDSSIKIWNRVTGELEQTLEGHTGSVSSVALSTDGKTIISGSDDNSIKIWNRATGKLEKTLEGHTGSVTYVALSQDGKTIISGSDDNSIKIWNRATGKLEKTLEGHTNSVSSVALSSDGKSIISGSDDSSIKIWNRVTGELEQTLEGHTGSVSSVALSTDGKTIISGSSDDSIKIWNRATGKLEKTLEGHTNSVSSVALSTDGKTIISGSDDNSIKIWNRATGELEQTLEGHTKYVNSVALSTDGKTIISGSSDDSIKIWNRATGKLEKTLEGHTSYVFSVALSTDGKTIISGSYDNSIKIWNRATGKLEQTLEGHTSYVFSVALSSDGKTIISGSDDNSIKIWNRATGELEKTLEGHTSLVSSVALSMDGKTIISGSDDNSIKIWNRATGELEKTLEGHTSLVSSVALSMDGKTIISGSDDNSIKIWNRATGELEKTLEGHRSTVFSVALSEDGKTIISGSSDGSVKIWNRVTGELEGEFLGGVNGCWQVFKYDSSPKKFFRGDDGTFLLKKRWTWMDRERRNGVSKISPIYPKEYNLTKEDNLSLSVETKSRLLSNEKSLELNVSIENQGQRTYWLKATTKSDYYAVEPNMLSSIGTGEQKNLLLKVYAKLPRENPRPLEGHELNVTVTTANGNEFYLSVPISIGYADINVRKAEVSKDGKNLNILVQNVGNKKLLKVDVNLSKPFQADIVTLTNLKPNASKRLSFALPESNKSVEGNISISFALPNEKEILLNPSGTKIAPAYVWQIDNVTIVLNKLAWYVYALWILAIVLTLLILILFFNPMVRKLKNPKELLHLKPNELKEAKDKLDRIYRFKNILSENSITTERYNNAIAFENLNQEEKANYFTKRIFAKAKPLTKQSYMLELNDDFPLNVKQFILFMSNKESIDDMMSEIKEIPQYRTHIIFVLSESSELQEKIYHHRDRYEKFVIMHPREITQILLGVDGAKALAESFSGQLALTQISPYQLGGGVKSSMFFGRAEIVSHILGRENSNYIVIGSRQIGKSSLLKAIEREYVKNREQVHYISVGKSDFVRAMARALDIKVKSLEELVAHLASRDEKSIFLLDEVDPFIREENKNGYKILDSFRKLSEEGRCNFILAGYWELYFYTMFDNQSPLKNFGEAIELGALEAEACYEMITEPMEQLGLKFESEEAIAEIIERTGKRPNLIAIICNNIIKNVGKEKRVITLEDVKEAIKGKKVYELFESWKKLDEDVRASRLDKIIVYSMVEKGSFRLKALVDRLKELGLQVEMSELENSLARLKVSYTIQRDEEGLYGFMLPLFREYVLGDDYEVKLVGEVEGYLG